jgi:ABC-type transport system involved in Fe-S cluster assembly fused permease/ATPase subunit
VDEDRHLSTSLSTADTIQNCLKSVRKGRTTFVIAHRLSIIQSADQILVLCAGEIVGRGTHDALLAQAGH